MAGVQITQDGGRPGQGADIIIRGASSTQGAPPLYIVDGIRMGTGNNFNIQDVESIEVLKDAGAAAIYGAQAAGGVILVTTKRGKGQTGLKVNFNGRYGIRSAFELYDLLDASDYIIAKGEVGETITDNGVNTDWSDELFGTGKEQNYNLGLSGGNETANFYASLNYQREDGIKINNYFERLSFRINSDFQLGKRFKVGESLIVWRTNDNPPADDGVLGDPFRSTPLMLVKDPANPAAVGGWARHPVGVNFAGGNPVAREYIIHQDQERYGVEGNLYLDVSLLDGLNFRTNLGTQFINGDNYRFQQEADFGGTAQPQQLRQQLDNWQQYTANMVLTYSKSFGMHDINLMGGYEILATNENSLTVTGGTFPVTVARSFELSEEGEFLVEGAPINDRLRSFFGRANYTFNDKYILQATLRRDESSKFGPDFADGTFPHSIRRMEGGGGIVHEQLLFQ